VQVEEQFATGVDVPGIKGFTTTLIGKVKAVVVLFVKLIEGLTDVAVVTVEVPPAGFDTVQL
jgi:hypothetical protein